MAIRKAIFVDANGDYEESTGMYETSDFVSTSAGVADADKPIKLDASGLIDNSMIDSSTLNGDLDHGLLSAASLLDDDHTQYLILDGSRGQQALSGDVTVQDPATATSIANKQYVDAVAEGLRPKEAVRVATTTNIDLSLDLENGDTIDGIVLATGDRVLVKDQSTASENGIYIVQASGAAVRAEDFDSLSPIDEINGAYVPVQEGVENEGKFFVQSGNVSVLETDDIDFVFFNAVASGVSGGDGITVASGEVSVDLQTGGGLKIDAAQLAVEPADIIGNGLIAYWLCQGWGNEPNNFNQEFLDVATRFIEHPESQTQDDFIRYLYTFERWHYTIHSSPKVVVLDTRTRRWRSESRMNKPSGLMDWEALIEFQHELMHQDKVVVVSAAPMFGVKVIEALQKAATIVGQPLVIDAENWMAHPGSANTLLSIFTHTKTPTNFVILSGDVHYSFAYDIKLRFRRNSPNIFQITCSGFKNQFPEPLLATCDHADRLLYSPRSPLNFLTKRKRLKIKKRDPDTPGVRRLVNTSAVGELKLDDHGKPSRVSILTGEGVEWDFPAIKEK